MAMQLFNNKNLDKFDTSLDTLNMVFFILSLIDLVVELLMGQLMKPESEYTLLSMKRIGMREDNGGVTDNSSDIDSQVSSDDDVSSQHPSTIGSKDSKPLAKRGLSAQKMEHYRQKFRHEEILFAKKEEMHNHDFLFMFLVSLVCVIAFSALQWNIF